MRTVLTTVTGKIRIVGRDAYCRTVAQLRLSVEDRFPESAVRH